MRPLSLRRDPVRLTLSKAPWTSAWYLLGYLFVGTDLCVIVLTLDTVVLAIWLVFLTGITLPVWYWAPWQTIHGVRYHGYQLGYFPNGPHGPARWGLYVDSLAKALLVAAVCLVAFLLFNYVLVAMARAHVSVARSLLSESTDPLKEAKKILREPGPLSAAEAAGRPAL